MNPLIKNVSIGVGGIVVAVAVYFGAVTAGNYQGAILHHLVDIIQGSNTRTIVALNAPNWGSGQLLATPTITAVATSSNSSAASGLASSTPYIFAIAALDRDGTTTISATATITTDASTTQNSPEDITVTWPSVTGAQGYAIYFATSSTATAFSQYFLASTTNGVPNTQFTFSTSTGSLSGSNTQVDTTAFANRVLPGSNSYFNGGPFGFGTSTPASSTPVDVNGYVRASRPATSTECYAATAGVVFYNAANQHEWGCNGTAWVKIF
jgi:hypothetical protein